MEERISVFFWNHVPENVAGGTYPVFESQWKQVILLWLGRKDVDEAQKDEFIGTSVGFEDETGRDFNGFRTLFLAAARIAEFQEGSRADEIVAQLVMVAFGFFSQELGEWLTWPKEVARAAMVALEDTEPERVVDALVKLIGNAQSQEARRQAAWTLGKIGQDNKTAAITIANGN